MREKKDILQDLIYLAEQAISHNETIANRLKKIEVEVQIDIRNTLVDISKALTSIANKGI